LKLGDPIFLQKVDIITVEIHLLVLWPFSVPVQCAVNAFISTSGQKPAIAVFLNDINLIKELKFRQFYDVSDDSVRVFTMRAQKQSTFG